MKYWAIKDETGWVESFGTTESDIQNYEVTEEEYKAIEQEMNFFRECVDKVYSDEMAIEDVPESMRDRVSAEVERMKEAASQPEPMSDIEEALAILSGEVTE